MDIGKWRNDAAFCAFAERLARAGVVFAPRLPAGATVSPAMRSLFTSGVSLHDAAGEPVSSEVVDVWLRLCLLRYLESRHRFAARVGSVSRLLVRLALLVVVVASLLYWLWPLWHVLVNVEDDHHRVLGVGADASVADIKRAYREQTRRWHPDAQPLCGEPCRERMVRVQAAYNTLMSRGGVVYDLGKRYREQLSSLRALIEFRLLRFIGGSSTTLLYALAHVLRWRDDATLRRGTAALLCSVLVSSFFVAYEVRYVARYNVLLIGAVLMRLVMSRKVTAAAAHAERLQRLTHHDEWRETLACGVLFVCSVLYHVLLHMSPHARTSSEVLEVVCRHVWGALFVLSYVHHFTPNVYDSVRQRQYSVPSCYMTAASPQAPRAVSRWSVLRAQGSVLLDDAFAFTCRVPSVYRVAVLLAHTVSLGLFAWLPHDTTQAHPRVDAATAAASVSLVRAALRGDAATSAPYDGDTTRVRHVDTHAATAATTAERDVNGNSASSRGALSEEQVRWVADLDGQLVRWSDVVLCRYRRLLAAAVQPRTRGATSTYAVAWLACTRNAPEHVRVCALGASAAARQRDAAACAQVLHSVRDPAHAALLARECGVDGGVASSEAVGLRTTSQQWRRAQCSASTPHDGHRTAEPAAAVTLQLWRGVCVLACTVAVLLCVLAPTHDDVLRSTRATSPHMRAHAVSRAAGRMTTLRGHVLLYTSDS